MRRRTLVEGIKAAVQKDTTRQGLEVKRGTVTGYRPTGSSGGTYNVQFAGGAGSGISSPMGAHNANSSVVVMELPGGGNVNTILAPAPNELRTNAAAEGFSADVTTWRLL